MSGQNDRLHLIDFDVINKIDRPSYSQVQLAMAKKRSVIARRPTTLLKRPITANVRELFQKLVESATHAVTGDWSGLAKSAAAAVGSLGLTDNLDDRVWRLVLRALTRAVFDLACEPAIEGMTEDSAKRFLDILNRLSGHPNAMFEIPVTFLRDPTSLPLLSQVTKILHAYLVNTGLDEASALAASSRLGPYFVFAVADELRTNQQKYLGVAQLFSSPADSAEADEYEWLAYRSWLAKQPHQSHMGESFSVSQLYVPLLAYYELPEPDDQNVSVIADAPIPLQIISLREHLLEWIGETPPQSATLLICGGPGSGKSTSAKMLVAELANTTNFRIIFVPLHLLNPEKDLAEGISDFLCSCGFFSSVDVQKLLSDTSKQILLVFDGLDELSKQGPAGAQTAFQFAKKVDFLVERSNLHTFHVRALISGRPLSIDATAFTFSKSGQVLHILPYTLVTPPGCRFVNWRSVDLRDQWWQQYGVAIGEDIDCLPSNLNRTDLEEITTQPLLNYLLAIAVPRDDNRLPCIDEQFDMNALYGRLIDQGQRTLNPLRHKNFHQEAVIPTAVSTFAHDAVL